VQKEKKKFILPEQAPTLSFFFFRVDHQRLTLSFFFFAIINPSAAAHMETFSMMALRELATEHHVPFRRSKADQWQELVKHGAVDDRTKSSPRSPSRNARSRSRSRSKSRTRKSDAKTALPPKRASSKSDTTTAVETETTAHSMPHYTHLIGPISLTEHILNRYNRHIYCFGDLHLVEPTCKQNLKQGRIQIERFVEQLAKSKPNEVFDVFVERAPPSYTGDATYMDTHIRRLYDTLQAQQYKNVRLHSVDPRILTRVWNQKRQLEFAFDTAKTLKAKKKALVDTRNAIANTNIQEEMDRAKITKQLNHVQSPAMKRMIQRDLIDAMQPRINRLVLRMDEQIKTFTTLTDALPVPSVFDYADEALMYFMDAYTMARMFRSYPDGPASEARNIILYVGNEHAEEYRGMFNRSQMQTMRGKFAFSHTEEDDFQCLNIQAFKQPFFSESWETTT
jgi:hypothetical protein